MAGSVYKRCTKCTAQLKDPPCPKCGADSFRWAYRVDAGKDSKGRRIQRSRGGFTRKKDATRALRELLRTIDEGRFVEPSKTTLAEYLVEEWLPGRKPRQRSAGRGHRGQLSLATWSTYRIDLQSKVIPRIGSTPLQDLAPAMLNRLYDELESSGKRARNCRTAGITCRDHDCAPEKHEGLSPKTVANVHGVLHRALVDAVKWGKVPRNVADAVEAPRADRTRTDVWTVDDLRAFLTRVIEDRLYSMWLLFATTGMRRGEVAGLAWPDLDLDAGLVRIDWTLGLVDAKPTWKSRPKSRGSKRTMALDPATVDALQAWRKRQLEERVFAGPAWASVNTDWRGTSREQVVFTWPDGRMINPDRISDWFHAQRRAAGLPRIRLHDIRHTYATAALANATGWHEVKVISERLGHASIGITIDTYAHVLPKADQETAETLARLILGTP